MTTRPTATVGLAPMGRADLPQVLAIEVAVASRPWTDAAFLMELNRDDRRYLVARSVGAEARGAPDGPAPVLGFVGVALYPDEAHVMTIAVDPAVQGRGIGTRLVRGMLGEVARAGVDAVTLEVREGNVAARHLYRRAGFDEAGERPAYYPDGENAVIMWRRRDVEVG